MANFVKEWKALKKFEDNLTTVGRDVLTQDGEYKKAMSWVRDKMELAAETELVGFFQTHPVRAGIAASVEVFRLFGVEDESEGAGA